jgi:cbb3-type cytochrome oxidase subunit 1
MYIVNVLLSTVQFFSNQCEIRTKGMYCANWYYMHGTILIEEAGLALSSCSLRLPLPV